MTDTPMPSLAWFKAVRDAVTRQDKSLTRDFAILANLPASQNRMLAFLDEHFPIPGLGWLGVPIDEVPTRLREWKPGANVASSE
jgi:hypothetical protein